MIRRRDLIAMLGVAALSWPLSAWAQQAAMPVVGVLGAGRDAATDSTVSETEKAMLEGLKASGFIEGETMALVMRHADTRYERLPAMADALVRMRVSVIVTTAGPASALAAKAATNAIPIVFNVAGDPVTLGLVANFNRPEANITGVSTLATELAQKRLELLHELVPTATAAGFLMNPGNVSATAEADVTERAAKAMGLSLIVLGAKSGDDFDAVFETLERQHVGILVVSSDAMFTNNKDRLITLAARHRIPTAYAYRQFASAGGLLNYGPDLSDAYRQSGVYAGRILKGEKPGDLPVVRPTKFVFTINLKTANVLGLAVAPSFIVRADEVIE